MSSDWRSSLREEEAGKLERLDCKIADMSAALSMIRKDRRALYLKARKRMERAQKGVDTVSEKA